jgi:uncharacterized protein (DUF2235 family)
LKNIVICSDGTGNTAIKGRGTNVFKIFEAVDQNGHHRGPAAPPQIAFYDDGVGTQSFKLLKLVGGATGLGLSRNVRQLYRTLCRVYDPGDRIFLFGFSRGAFTVRTLVGLISACGIIDARQVASGQELRRCVGRAYRAYRHSYDPAWLGWLKGKLGRRGEHPAVVFKREHAYPGDPDIAFVGVWDTVDAVGLPFRAADLINALVYRFKFPDHSLSPLVKHARQALALDDERTSFQPVLWREDGAGRIEQVWFAGAHSNVGGGYPKQGLSLVALDWMMGEAQKAGLRFHDEDRSHYANHASADDKLYDPRSGPGCLYRWGPRDVAELCRRQKVAPRIHVSVLERIAHGTEDYAPGNLLPEASVVYTESGDPAKDAASATRAGSAQAALRSIHGEVPSLQGLWRQAALGHLARLGPVGLLPVLALGDGVATPSPMVLASALAGAVGLLLLAGAERRRLRRHLFSQFWHPAQRRLRDALK